MPAPVEHRLEVPKTARYYTVGDAAGARDVWFVLHGYSQLAAQFITYFSGVARPGRLIVAPEALHRYYTDHAAKLVGATWMTREDRSSDIADYVRYLDRLAEVVLARVPSGIRVCVLGFSQGGTTASRWVAMGAVRPQRLIVWGEALPHDLDLGAYGDRLRAVDLMFVAGERDQFVTAEKLALEEARLQAAGLPYRLVRFPGGHRLDRTTLAALAEGAA